MKAFLRAYGLTLLLAAGILYLSLASGSGLPKTHLSFPHADKLVHLLMYAALAAVFARDLRRAGHPFRHVILLAILLPAAYGGLIELIQPFFPPRTCEFLDWISDLMGALAGYLTADYVWIRRHSSTK